MKESTPQNPTPRSGTSILIRGAPGCGKTVFSLQFPRVYHLDCDENLAAADAFCRASWGLKMTDLSYKYARVRFDDKDAAITDLKELWPNYVRHFNEAVAQPYTTVSTIVTDSLTGLDQILLRRVLSEQGREAEVMRIQDWIPFRNKLNELALRMKQTGKINIVCCHEEVVKDNAGNLIKYDITLSSRLSDYFGWVFSDVWYLEGPRVLGGKFQPPQLYCQPMQYRSDLKNSFGMPPQIPAVWSEVNKYLKLT